MTEYLPIKSLMSLYLFDYLEPEGAKKIRNQQIEIIDGLAFVARCKSFRENVVFEFSLGLGFSLAQMCISYLTTNFKIEFLKTRKKPFYDITNNLNNFSELTIEEIDKELLEILLKVKDESNLAYDYFFRLFEYSLGYIALHELGHYINGHLGYFNNFKIDPTNKYYITERQIAELQADIFATQFLLNKNVYQSVSNNSTLIPSFKKIGDFDWETCVTHAIYLTFILLEKLSSNELGKIHPPAIFRIINSSKHIIGAEIWSNSNSATTKFEKILNEIFDYSKSFNISTTNWISSLYTFWGESDNITIQPNTNAFEVLKLQINSKDFKLKLKNYSIEALDQFNLDTTFIKLIVLSGQHIPWQLINTEEFYYTSLDLIDFTNESVISSVHSSKDSNLLNLLKIMTENEKKYALNFESIIAEIDNCILMEIDQIFELIGERLLVLKMVQTKEEINSAYKIQIGKFWFEKFKELLKDKIQNSNTFNYYKLKNSNKFDYTLIFALSDIIERICVGLSPHIVAVLLFKKDLANL